MVQETNHAGQHDSKSTTRNGSETGRWLNICRINCLNTLKIILNVI